MSIAKDNFIEKLIIELNSENKRRIIYDKEPINICFIVSALDQQLDNCKEFINILNNKEWFINGYEEDDTGGYTYGRIEVLIEKKSGTIGALEDYCYYINFSYDDRNWGYCQCIPEDDDYNEVHKCCGNGCDWTAPAFNITKEIYVHSGEWDGLERDYWEYEDKFNKNQKNRSIEVEEYKKEQKRKNLEKQIKELQGKLDSLHN